MAGIFDISSELKNIRFLDTGTSEIAYRVIGKGDPLVLLHGWPLSGFTYRKILPSLAEHFTCYVLDLPGAGETKWNEKTDFRFAGQAENIKTFISKLRLESYSLLAHDTGATIGRQLAIIDPLRVKKMVVIDTEIPNHRPPWIPLYQMFSHAPFSSKAFQFLLSSDAYLKTRLGFAGCFYDPELINGEFKDLYVRPLIHSNRKMLGQINYLRGIDWDLIDGLEKNHSKIKAPVLLIWGKDDPIFPVELGRQMASQFLDCKGFEAIARAKLLVHEERPEEVSRLALSFLLTS